MDALKAQEETARQAYLKVAKSLSNSRGIVARDLGKAVTDAMQDLSMAGGSFQIGLNQTEPAAYGLEQVEFLVSRSCWRAGTPAGKGCLGWRTGTYLAGHLCHYLLRHRHTYTDLR